MKKLFLAATVAMAIFASCSKETTEPVDVNGSVVEIKFVNEPSETRAFFGTTAAAEVWEKSISEMTIFVFNNSGNIVTQRYFSPAEIAAKSASFALPGVTAGENCEFYALANFGAVPRVANKSAIMAFAEGNGVLSNGTFAEVTTGAKRPGGIVMSGSVSGVVAAVGSTTNVAIALKRTVAKIAVQTTQGADFNNFYPGAVKVTNVSINKAAQSTRSIKPTVPITGEMTYGVSQVPNLSGKDYQNLFYLFENGALAAGSRVQLIINAIYDVDGNFATTTDQFPMTYTVELEGNGTGAIVRNGYYRLVISINGLSGSDASMTITVADWETPITQTINIGV